VLADGVFDHARRRIFTTAEAAVYHVLTRSGPTPDG
jgi:hypothetical protein